MNTVQIWNDMQQSLRGFIQQQVGDEFTTDDILQEVFIKMQTNLHQLRQQEKVKQWLFQITRNAILDYFRQIKKDRQLTNASLPTASTVHTENELNEIVASWIPPTIALLPEKYREAVYLTEIEGLSQKELAERLNLSYSGAKSRVQRGRAKLKAIILECCDVQTDRYGNVLDFRKREPEECCD